MRYFRIRKTWNNGKWVADQIGAYTSLEAAKLHITQDLINAGYKIFSPDGEIVYPEQFNELSTKLYDAGIVSDKQYWSDVFDGKIEVSLDNLKYLCQNALSNLVSSGDFGTSKRQFIYDHDTVVGMMFKPQDFQIRYLDAIKSKLEGINCVSCFNLGYFGNYTEGKQKFTLPGANLVADIDVTSVPEEVLQYLRERKISPEGKLHYSANKSTPEFRDKKVSTLVIYKSEAYGSEYMAQMAKLNDVDSDEILYAISGAPVIWNRKKVTDFRSEGWDNSITRATYHGILGLKGQQLYYFWTKTTSSDCITSGELYNFLQPYELDYAIKVDGGGSFYAKLGEAAVKTSENRRINNVGIIRY